MNISDKLRTLLNSEQLDQSSVLYRFTLPEFLDSSLGNLRLSANPHATEMVEDFYESGHSMMAKHFGPGLAFTTGIEADFQAGEHILVSIRLGDALEQGGLVYPDVSSFAPNSKSYFITLPEGSIAVTKIQ